MARFERVGRTDGLGVTSLETLRPSFGRIAKVAKALFGAAVADVIIVNERFTWSSRDGKRESGSSVAATAALAQDGVLWIEDASRDPLWATEPMVAGPPYIRFYAAVPFRSSDGEKIGVLSVIDDKPHARDARLAERLTDLAHVVGGECEREQERQALKKAEERLNMALKLADMHVWEMDYARGTLEKAGAEASFYERPITYEDIFNDPYGSTIHADDVPLAQENFRRQMAGEKVPPNEVRTPRTDGKEVWCTSAVKAYTNDKGVLVRMIGVMQNITQRKEAEAAMIRARDEAEAANRSKSEFLANMSHEIRTPLNGVMGIADALARTDLSPHQKELVSIVEASAKTLESLLTDLLDFARIESGRLEIKPEPFDLGESIRACTALFEPNARAKGLDFRVEVAEGATGTYLGDAPRLRQIVLNLLSNAVKFTNEGGVGLKVSAHKHGDVTRLTFAVMDTGIGFDAEAGNRLFQRFEQADGSITRQFGGTGLGLAISRSLALAMGGTLEATSTPGKGSTFTLTLDCKAVGAAAAPAIQTAANPAAEAGAMRVLVAEDHPTNRKVAELILTSFGVDLTFAENGQEAVDAFRTQAFDLVLMDMQMPVMDGLTAIREIRAMEAAEGRHRTPVYTLSANALPEHAQASMEAGADGHETKPVTSEKLLAVLVAASEMGEMSKSSEESSAAA